VSLRGRVCVVTGASRGLGRAIAELLAAEGMSLALCARGERQLHAAAETIREKYGIPVFKAALDVRAAAAVHEFAEDSRRVLGPAYALVNNAAVLGPVGRIDTVDLEAWRQAIEVNVAGVANLSAAFAPQMTDIGRGSIINVSGGGTGGPNVPGHISAYTTAKAAVVVLTETLAKELASARIRVNAIAPGPLETAFLKPVLEAGPEAAGTALYEDSERRACADEDAVEMNEDFASLVRYLLSDDSEWLTGKLVSARWDSVDGLQASKDRLLSTSLLTLRRIDETLFGQLDESP
jgi:NAD(P)-dependent dehydrogenase (short-subunit alcohol dehydrogenase family)